MKNKLLIILLIVAALCGCKNKSTNTIEFKDPLPSWTAAKAKLSIIEYVKIATAQIPVEDRIAVFDMDGTIACEAPLWFEMYCAVAELNMQSKENPVLLKYPEYQFAKKLAINPADTSVQNNWVTKDANYVDSMVWKAFAGVDNEKYVNFCSKYLSTTQNKDYNIFLSNMFYQPMIELINYLIVNNFSVYVVSGSVQGVIWSVCPQKIGLDRNHLIGTRQILIPSYPKKGQTQFTIQKGIFLPKDDKDGKTLNIYSQVGKTPVFAFGNTNGDFGMFHYASTSTYPHACYLLNHDDTREYVYPPYHGTPVKNWNDSLINNGWNLVNMSESFKTIWKIN